MASRHPIGGPIRDFVPIQAAGTPVARQRGAIERHPASDGGNLRLPAPSGVEAQNLRRREQVDVGQGNAVLQAGRASGSPRASVLHILQHKRQDPRHRWTAGGGSRGAVVCSELLASWTATREPVLPVAGVQTGRFSVDTRKERHDGNEDVRRTTD